MTSGRLDEIRVDLTTPYDPAPLYDVLYEDTSLLGRIGSWLSDFLRPDKEMVRRNRPEKQRGWVAAERLKPEDSLTDNTGGSVSIRALSVESRDARTFNLSVEGTRTFFVVAGMTPILVHNVDPWDILYTQPNYGRVFTEGPWAGRLVTEAIAEARLLGRLPDGLTLNAVRMGDGTWAALNNRTLAVARGANLPNVNPVEAGASGLNKMNQLLRNGGLAGPVDNAVMRCK